MYAIKTPGGQLLPKTISSTKAQCYDKAYGVDLLTKELYTRGLINEYNRRLRRAGYRCVKVVVSEA